MLAAEEYAVVEIGRATVLPLADVMGLGAGNVDAAAGEGAVPVAGLEGAAQAGRDATRGAADVEDIACTLAQPTREAALVGESVGLGVVERCRHRLRVVEGCGDDRGDLGVAEDPAYGLGGKQHWLVMAWQEQLATAPGDEVAEIDGHGDMGCDAVA